MYKLNDPLFSIHSGFYLNQQGEVDSLALATVGFLKKLDTTTAKFCLFVLLKRDIPNSFIETRTKPITVVRKRNATDTMVYTRKVPTVDTKIRLIGSVTMYKRNKPHVEIYIDNCNE